MKAFCLVCHHLIRSDYCLGHCKEHGFRIHKPFRNCSKYYPSVNVNGNPFHILKWYNRALELAKIKRDNVYLFFELEPPKKPLFLLWINHGDSNELVGVYTEKPKAEYDASRIEPKTHIGEYQLNQGKSIFLEPKPIQPGEEET